jgi:hypothetical protein
MVSSAAIFGYVELSAAARAAESAFEHIDDVSTVTSRVERLLIVANDALRSSESISVEDLSKSDLEFQSTDTRVR